MKKYIVTGGAGFVGSHLVALLVETGAKVVVLDNFRQGHLAAIPPGVRVVDADLADAQAIDDLLGEGGWDAVFHFASLALVGESMHQPFRYLRDNVGNGIRLIEACVRHKMPRFILSSTSNLFSNAKIIPIPNDAEIEPCSPYGESKWMIERVLHWAGHLYGMRYACLRYFNAAGADPSGRLGEDHDPETHIIPLTIDAALGRCPPLKVFGNDYPTPDGTCIRDYIHVCDLATAHLRALELLDHGSVTYNLGNGKGYSVLEVIQTVEAVSGLKVPHSFAPRRPGDPPILVASSDAFRAATGWAPKFGRLEDMVRTSYEWRVKHPFGYRSV